MYKEVVDYIKLLYPKKDFIPLHEPLFVGNDKEYVMDAINSTFVSSVGKYVDRFEDMIKEYTQAKFAIATVNGTAALHMCLIAGGVKRDDLVITQPLSFIATCNAINYIGAEPLFIDVSKKTLGLSAEKLEEFLVDKTEIKNGGCFHKETGKRLSACVPMHTFGHPVEVDKINALCEKYHVTLIEDAAESIGSFYNNKHTGTTGKLAAFSFNGNKTITCGGGGIITTNDEALGKHIKHLTTQAKIPHRWEFNHDYIGYNYRLPNLNAAMACAQMEKLEEFLANKRELAVLYKDFFNKINISFFEEPEGGKSNYWLNAIFLNDKKERDNFLQYTNDNGVMTRPAWTLMNKLSMFKTSICENIENAEWIEDRLVCIPSSVRI
jgi:perosamine synthetase